VLAYRPHAAQGQESRLEPSIQLPLQPLQGIIMNSIIYIVGLIVVVLFVARLLGLG
jgi:hypothetical protein